MPAMSADYSRITPLAEVKAIGVLFKKVTLKHIADFQQQLRVNGRSVEYLIDICAITIKLARQPNHRTLLRSEFVLNGFANKNLVHRYIT